jgi:hypothetical protein
MSDDISKILDDWQYNPDAPTVRIIRGDDGREMVQLRIDLGLLQMAMDGRPDGERPEGCESWLEYYCRQQERHDGAHPDSAPFQLDIEACRRLWSEGIQYYHRYVSFWHLKRFDLCARDTRRNLELFAFVREYGPGDRAKMQFDQWRPYVLMMHARAVATPLAEAGQIAEALLPVESAIDEILEFLDQYDQSDRADESAELADLRRWREELLSRQTPDMEGGEPGNLEDLRRRLQEAVAAEEFEDAARLRDQIRRMTTN